MIIAREETGKAACSLQTPREASESVMVRLEEVCQMSTVLSHPEVQKPLSGNASMFSPISRRYPLGCGASKRFSWCGTKARRFPVIVRELEMPP
jgi:hypothetical protein